MKIVEEDLSLCHALAAAMQQHWPDLVTYVNTIVQLQVCHAYSANDTCSAAAVARQEGHDTVLKARRHILSLVIFASDRVSRVDTCYPTSFIPFFFEL